MARTPIAYRYVRGVRKMRGKRLMQGRVWITYPSDWHRKHGHRTQNCWIYRAGKRIKAYSYPGDGYWMTTGGWKKV
jgi:hypothetical protein